MNGNESAAISRSSAKRLRAARRSGPQSGRTQPRRGHRAGLTAIEYCFLLSIILMGILLAVQHFGSTLKASFNYSDSKMQQIGL